MNSILSYPNYSRQDNQMLFDAMDQSNQRIVAIVPLNADKMSASGDAFIFENDARWADWFGRGDRNLYVGLTELEEKYQLSVYPNPFTDQFRFQMQLEQAEQIQYVMFDLLGNEIIRNQKMVGAGELVEEIDLSAVASGAYILNIRLSEGSISLPVFKID